MWEPKEIFPSLQTAKMIAIDTETRDPLLLSKGPGFIRRDGNVVGVSIAVEGFHAYYPIAHEGGGNLNAGNVVRYLRKELSTGIPKVGANIQYDLGWLRTLAIFVNGPKYDVLIAEPLIDENRYRYDLDSVAQKYLGEEKKDYTLLKQAMATYGTKKEKDMRKDLWKYHSQYVGEYAEQDAILPLKIIEQQWKVMEDQGLLRVWELETGLVDVLLDMKFLGVKVNLEKAHFLIHDMKKRLEAEHKKLDELIGVTVDVWSNLSIARACEQIGVPFMRTDKGNPSFQAKWLGLMADVHPLFSLIQSVRKIDRAKTYVTESIINMEVKGRVHCDFRQVKSDVGGTGTGRFSSSNPNLQQVPARDDTLAPLIRGIFEPEDGCDWVKADYCFSDDTEVLTRSGWKLFKDLKALDKLAEYLPSGEIRFEYPTEYQRSVYSGEMCHIYGKKTVDLLVTPNHFCILRSAKGEIRRVMAKDYPDRGFHHINAGMYAGNDLRLDWATIQLLCAIQADGIWGDAKRLRFNLKKERKHIRLDGILSILNIPFKKHTFPSKKGFIIYYIKKSDLPKEVTRYLSFPEKIFSLDLIDLSYLERLWLIDGLCFWDGSHQTYSTTVKENREFASMVFALTDHRTTCRDECLYGRKTLYSASYSNRPYTWIDRFVKERIEYEGEVFCVTMPSHTVIVRRNGRISVCSQSQQEPRLTVHYACKTRCEKAEEARQRYIDNPNTDYHQMTADMCGIDRTPAKAVNLGLTYGMGEGKLGLMLGKTPEETRELFEQYHAGVPYVKQLTEKCTNSAVRKGFVRTFLGRRRRFERWDGGYGTKALSKEEALSAYNYRIFRAFTYRALNSVIQGSGGDMVKSVILTLYREEIIVPHLTVHDEIDWSNPKGDMAKIKLIKGIMEDIFPSLLVPMKADISIGDDWGHCKEIEL